MLSLPFFRYLVRFYLLSIFFFFQLRLSFVLYHHASLPAFHAAELAHTFGVGALMDSAVLCSALFSSLLLTLLLSPLLRSRATGFFIRLSNILAALLFFINLADIFYFNQYGTRLNTFAGEALYDPVKIISTAWKIYPIVRILLCYLVLIWLFLYFQSRIRKRLVIEKNSVKWGISSFLFLVAFSFLYYGPPMWTLSNFSASATLNQASSNGVYSLVKSWDQQRMYSSDIPAYDFYPDQDALRILQDSVVKTNEQLINPDFPTLRSVHSTDTFRKKNVVIIILESFGSRFIGKLNEGKGLSPAFDRYADSGMFFTHFHSNGPRTQNGIMSTVSGFPSILGVNLQRKKGVNEFQTLGNILLRQGYATQFLHNGHANYDDMDQFMRQGGFQSQLDVNDYTTWRIKNEWGVSDEDLYEKAYDRIWSKGGEPVLSVLLTMSNHEPHEVPEQFRKAHPEMEGMDAKQATFYYSDRALGDFLDKCSRHPQYKNTLFVLVGDHGEAYGPEDNVCKIFHIPCLILNSKKGKGVLNYAASQCDVPATILNELGFSGSYPFIGQDMLGPHYKPYAFLRSYGNEVFLCRDSILLRYYFETGTGEFYYVDKHHYQRGAADVPDKVKEQMIAYTKAYMQSISGIFRKGQYRIKD